jgi:hypothetical protein
MTSELIAVLDGQIIGRVTSNGRARLTLTYDEKMALRAYRLPAFHLDAAHAYRTSAPHC